MHEYRRLITPRPHRCNSPENLPAAMLSPSCLSNFGGEDKWNRNWNLTLLEVGKDALMVDDVTPLVSSP
jgi:hypothetical protein